MPTPPRSGAFQWQCYAVLAYEPLRIAEELVLTIVFIKVEHVACRVMVP